MVDLKLAKEFLDIDDLNKFSRGSYYILSDRIRCCNWFNSFKKEIEKSDNLYCLLIMEQYKDFCELVKERKKYEANCNYKAFLDKKKIFNEFANETNLDKFDLNSDIFLSNGIKMSIFFVENYSFIKSSKDYDCQKIMLQYNKYLYRNKQKKKMNLIKNKFEFSKLSEDKFYDDSKLILSNNENAYLFFIKLLEYYKTCLNLSNLDLEILRQYNVFSDFYSLKEEFYFDRDMSKYDEFGYVRFSNGAIKNDWWSVYKDDILNSYHDIDVKIKNQYNSYIKKD